ncbi:MAG: peptidoglycan editing factor PgeF [Spirochaetota bacterium]|nr:peptidoglycan editing factor PgeF [Spirochaetota bacterium]
MCRKPSPHHNVIELCGDLIAGTTSRTSDKKDYNLSLSAGDQQSVIANRKHLFQKLSVPSNCAIFARQVHGSDIVSVSVADKGFDPECPNNIIGECDALMTDRQNVLLCVQTADCLPIFLFDPVKQAIALVHAGWRGTEKRILPKTIQSLCEVYNSNTEDIKISFGPGIHSCCYEVSPSFQNIFQATSLYRRGDRHFLDLIKENSLQAMDLGISENHILTKSSVCTACNIDEYFSYRKEGDLSGRMISYLALT